MIKVKIGGNEGKRLSWSEAFKKASFWVFPETGGSSFSVSKYYIVSTYHIIWTGILWMK